MAHMDQVLIIYFIFKTKYEKCFIVKKIIILITKQMLKVCFETIL